MINLFREWSCAVVEVLRLSSDALGRRSKTKIFGNCLRSRLDMQLFVNVPEVGADGVDANAELVADLLVCQPFN